MYNLTIFGCDPIKDRRKVLYNQINAHALIGQSPMVHCASKPMEKSRSFRIVIKAIDPKFLWFRGTWDVGRTIEEFVFYQHPAWFISPQTIETCGLLLKYTLRYPVVCSHICHMRIMYPSLS